MNKYFLVLLCLCILMLFSCNRVSQDEIKWNCSIVYSEEHAEAFLPVYSEEQPVSKDGVLTLQNPNNFAVIVFLSCNGVDERKVDIEAGGVTVLKQIQKGIPYTVGCYADVEAGTEIKLFVFDGENADVYVN